MHDVETVAADVIDAALHLHRDLGPGLLESVYEAILAAELEGRGYPVVRQQPADIEYKGMRFEAAFRVDLVVDRQVLVEIKSVERLNGAHAKQLLTYLRLTKRPLGLLINFGGETFEARAPPDRQRLPPLRAFAPSREPNSGVRACSTLQE